ncbi:peptidase of plants and bacteria-domain-containing protein [Podospora appendiculata]|uniref:Peptidase of plants and bacteria-domain-containing protein n=1 Tax=Podospora appendiculata TaxID=314037 RepID=A0AAE1CCH8_9PEZI|nr:peptidase of plants and bacteria-domain-containing protein [Podospora appendiculata]
MTVVVPQTTPAPKPTAIFMPPTSTAPAPTPTAGTAESSNYNSGSAGSGSGSGAGGAGGGDDDGRFPQPKLRLEIRDLDHPGTAKFLDAVNAGTVVSAAVSNVQRLLYRSPGDPHTTVPPTRSVTLILRDMGGVAYTTGTDLDDDHKEIHFSLGYINGINPPARLAAEITGVLTHELVHCYQWNALGTCPGGLIEGIADWVRLSCDLSPPHWKRETTGGMQSFTILKSTLSIQYDPIISTLIFSGWDNGYQHTAYFLDYLEGRFGKGTVRKLNEKLRRHRYEPKPFWTELLGRPVEQLWGDYVESLAGEQSTVDEGTQT